jgi:hypothetical protein
MPSFLSPNAEELNELRGINKRIVKDMRKKFKGTEQTLGSSGDVQDKYDFIYEKMVEILGSLGEISNQLKLGHTAPMGQGSKAIDRFIGGTSAVLKATKILLDYITREVPSIRIFPIEQQQSISGMNDQIVAAVLEIDNLSTNFLQPAVLTRFRSVISGIKGDLTQLQQRLEGQSGSPAGTGSLGDSFNAPSNRAAFIRAANAATASASAAARALSPSPRRGRPRNIGSGYMGTGQTMVDGYGDGYRTQIAGSGSGMPTRFL